MEKITIVYQRDPTGFGKAQTLNYEGVVFSNGKVAYIDEDGTIYAHERQDELLIALNKKGKARIDGKKRKHEKD